MKVVPAGHFQEHGLFSDGPQFLVKAVITSQKLEERTYK